MKYTLIQSTNVESRPISNPKSRYFFCHDIDEANCYNLDSIIDMVYYQGLKTVKLHLAEREIGSDMFYCAHFGEVGEKGDCGKHCKGYDPRNGKSGVCKHFGYTYSDTGIKFELEIIEQ